MGMKLEPVVQIGKEGVTPSVVQAAREAIKKRELIKVRVLQNCMELPADAIAMVAERADANLVQVIAATGCSSSAISRSRRSSCRKTEDVV